MDVTCPRCQTDYEFDDALVSERGTTVKCTNCGHQFRVFRARGGGATTTSPELWRIERRQGEPLELRSLVELQRAIRAGRVSRDDLLRRGDGPARRVGDIPELEPFFPAPRADNAPSTLPLGGAAAGPGAKTSVGVGLANPPVVTEGPRVPAHTPAYGANRPGSVPPPPPATGSTSHRPGAGVAPPPPRITDRPLAPARLPTPIGLAPPPVPPSDLQPQAPPTPQARLVPSAPPPRTAPIPPPPRTGDPELEPPTIRRTDMRVSAPAAPPAGPVRASDAVTQSVPPRPMDSVTQSVPPPRGESYESLFPTRPKRRSGAGWLVALVLIGGLVALGATVGRPYLEKLTGRGAAPAASSVGSDRLQRELAVGDRARNDGDWAGAREAYLRATVVDEKSLVAWDGLCTAESELAMAHWIAALASKSALERDQAASIGASAAKSCARWSELERGASSDGAKKVAGDMRPVRAVAAQGDGSGVRVYLPVHPGDPFVEALAYLADVPKGDHGALDKASKSAAASLARAEIDKLASSSELALVAYGAAVTGNASRHGAALAELGRRAPRDPLLETLRGLVAGDAGPAPHDAAVAPADAAVTDAKSAVAVVGGGAPTGGGGEEPAPAGGDYRSLNEKGHKALASGEVTKAEAYFKAALAQHPGDVDALFGLGQISRSRGDHAQAITYFKQVLDTSAGFAPARLALADEQWAVGDKAAAAKNYELYLERVSEGSGADRARARLGKSTDTKIEPKQGDPKPEEGP
ncbi:MAG: zinc-ribbon domain-containing protein [Deltaproteobacteria bacterium]|nr:zinc-ribbon domain-containing protein [Deltaproteobacteria bacterium]